MRNENTSHTILNADDTHNKAIHHIVSLTRHILVIMECMCDIRVVKKGNYIREKKMNCFLFFFFCLLCKKIKHTSY